MIKIGNGNEGKDENDNKKEYRNGMENSKNKDKKEYNDNNEVSRYDREVENGYKNWKS